MANLTLSDKYGIAAAIGMMLIVLINSAVIMLVVSVIGIIAGLWVVRHSGVRRVAYVAFAGFAIAAAFAVYGLVRGG